MSSSGAAAELVTYMATTSNATQIYRPYQGYHELTSVAGECSPIHVGFCFIEVEECDEGKNLLKVFKRNVYILSLITFQSCGESHNPFEIRINVAAQNFCTDLEATP